MSLATGILVFKGVSRADYRKLQDLYCAFQDVPFQCIAELPDGVAYIAFTRASDPRYRGRAFRMFLRPTATWACGETIAVV